MDALIVLHAVRAISTNPGMQVAAYSPNTDALSIRSAYKFVLSERTIIYLSANRFARVRDIQNAISLNRCVALIGFRAYPACCVTGKFGGEGKGSYWKLFVNHK